MPLIDDIGLEEAKAILHKIADIFHIGVEARQTDTILANATNAADLARRKLLKSDPVELQIGREARAAYRRFSEFRQFTSNFSVVFKTEDDVRFDSPFVTLNLAQMTVRTFASYHRSSNELKPVRLRSVTIGQAYFLVATTRCGTRYSCEWFKLPIDWPRFRLSNCAPCWNLARSNCQRQELARKANEQIANF